MADLPGPEDARRHDPARAGRPAAAVNAFTLTTAAGAGHGRARVGVVRCACPHVVKPGDRLFLNDGLIQLIVDGVDGDDVRCHVAVGGELRSRKGLNLPGIDLGISAFTDHDRACLAFALAHGVDAVSQSFVETAADIRAVRDAARGAGRPPVHHREDRTRRARWTTTTRSSRRPTA